MRTWGCALEALGFGSAGYTLCVGWVPPLVDGRALCLVRAVSEGVVRNRFVYNTLTFRNKTGLLLYFKASMGGRVDGVDAANAPVRRCAQGCYLQQQRLG